MMRGKLETMIPQNLQPPCGIRGTLP